VLPRSRTSALARSSAGRSVRRVFEAAFAITLRSKEPPWPLPMKMILAIVQERDSARLIEALVGRQFHVTKLAGMGGFLRKGNATVLIGVEEHQADDVLRLIEDMCQQGERVVRERTVRGGGATVFVLNVSRMVRVDGAPT